MHLRRLTMFLSLFCSVCPTSNAASAPTNTVLFTSEERKWIADHPTLRVGVTPEWAPFSYLGTDGKRAGIDIDILEIISRRTGFKFEIVSANSWEKIVVLLEKGEIDFTTSTAQTPERDQILHFTQPYFQSGVVIVARGFDQRFSHLSLLHDARIVMPADFVTTEAVEKRLPTARVLEAKTLSDCLEMVSEKKADVTVANLHAASQYLNTHPRANLGIVGVIPEFDFPLCLAIRREQPILAKILDKCLATISRGELDQITRRHLLFGLQGAQRTALMRRWIKLTLAGAFAIAVMLFLRNQFLCKEVRARRKAEAELLAINRSLEVFSHSLSHDLRAPVRAISSFAQLLKEEYGEKIGVDGRDYLERISSSATRISNLVRDVLAYSKTARADFPLHQVSLHQIVNQLIGEFPPEQRAYFKIETGLPDLWSNSTLIAQCMSNLLSNAIKFVPADRRPDIRIRAERDNLTCKIWVEDNGIGIAPENQERIFEIFERVRTPGYEGSGIGLALIAKAMERTNGQVGVESELGKGSKFWIQVPLFVSSKAETQSNFSSRFFGRGFHDS